MAEIRGVPMAASGAVVGRVLVSCALLLALMVLASVSPARAQDEDALGPDAATTIDVTIDAPEGSGPYAVSFITEEVVAAMLGGIGPSGFGGFGGPAVFGVGGSELAAGSTTTLPIVTEGTQAAVLLGPLATGLVLTAIDCTDGTGDATGTATIGAASGLPASGGVELDLSAGPLACTFSIVDAADLGGVTVTIDAPEGSGPFTFGLLTTEAIVAAGQGFGQGFGALGSSTPVEAPPAAVIPAGGSALLATTSTEPVLLVSEPPPTGLTLTGVTCTGPDGETVGMPVDLAVVGLPIPGAISIDLAATPNVACTATYTEGTGQSGGSVVRDDPDRDDPDRGLDTGRSDDPRGITPREGRWSGTNGRGAIECGGFSQAIPAGNPDHGTIRVRNGGDRLILRGLNEGATRPIRVDRVKPGSDRFAGTSRLDVQGFRAVFTFTLRVRSETTITGRTSAKVRVQGQQCEVSRPFALSFDG